MAFRKVNDDSLSSVAEAIRAKGGTTETLVFPEGFVSAIGAIQAALEVKLQDKTVFYIRSGMSLVGFTERLSVTEIREKKTIDAAEWVYSSDRYVNIENNSLMARVSWQYESAEQAIDQGRMTVVKAITNDLTSVDSLEVSVSG